MENGSFDNSAGPEPQLQRKSNLSPIGPRTHRVVDGASTTSNSLGILLGHSYSDMLPAFCKPCSPHCACHDSVLCYAWSGLLPLYLCKDMGGLAARTLLDHRLTVNIEQGPSSCLLPVMGWQSRLPHMVLQICMSRVRLANLLREGRSTVATLRQTKVRV